MNLDFAITKSPASLLCLKRLLGLKYIFHVTGVLSIGLHTEYIESLVDASVTVVKGTGVGPPWGTKAVTGCFPVPNNFLLI